MVKSVSGAITRELGLDPEAVCGAPFHAIADPADRDVAEFALRTAGAGSSRQPVRVEVGLRDRHGVTVPYELSVVAMLDDPTVAGYIVSAHDITRLRDARAALEELATCDGLTGLLNRRAFDAALEREWTLTSRDGIDSYVAVMDLDGFKRLNDSAGHAAGDEALRRFASMLRTSVRHTDIVGRIGGDEFAVVLVRCGGAAAALGLEHQLSERLHTAGDGRVAVSIGHWSLRNSESPADALHRADLAMLAAKEARRTLIV
jgi:diguanylate cyclase (GGDEF)-like protein/PAS domain S-box-containing protein